MNHFKELQKDTEGAGGKGGGSGGSESKDTLQTNQIIKILHLIGEGVVNLYTGDGQSIFLNNTPLVNSDGSYNFGAYDQTHPDATTLYKGAGATYWEWRSGTPSQSAMTNPAFPSASAVFTVNAEILGGTTTPLVAAAPVTYTVSNANVDYCKVAVKFPNGILNVDSSGNIVGDNVTISIDVKPRTSGTWTNVINRNINDKSNNAAVLQFQVNNPNPTALWDIRVSRLTKDNSNSTRKNQTYVDTIEEVQQVTLPYNGIAYAGLALDAATIGGQGASIPSMSFLVQRGPIAIPSNYNPATWTFTGTWDGTFTTGITDDPAWVLWDMLTNQQYGCYLYGIRAANLDKYSFYNASVFNNAQVSNGVGGYEPRFTFNAPIQNRQDMLVSLQQVATMMNASIGVVNGLITIFQDRPVDPKYLINKSRVIASDPVNPTYFKYMGNTLTNRYTAVNVTWVNATNVQYLPTTTTVKDSTGVTKYGYQPTNVAAFGATTIGQAHRAGKYWLYENLYNTETVEFEMGTEGFISQVDDVFDLYDDDYAGRVFSGRTVSATTNTITLDQPVIIDSGVTSYLWVLLQNGVTYEQHTITNTAGTYSALNISGTFSTTPTQYTPWGVVSSVSPRTFKIKDIKIDGVSKVVTVTARLYNKNNYTYCEGTYTQPTAVYTQPILTAPAAPTGLTSHPTQYINTTNGHLQYGVTVEWVRPDQNTSYLIKWRKDSGQYTTSAQFQTNSYQLEPIVDGTYDFLVYSVNITGRQSAPATISYTLDTTGGNSSTTLTEITGLSVDGGGTSWTGLDLPVTWTNPTANQGLLKDFVVTFKTTGGTLLRQVVVDGVVGGAAQSYHYTYAMNQADGGPNRSIAVTVQGRDSSNNTTTGITATLTNAAPPVPSNIGNTPMQETCIISWTPEAGTDVAGYIVWCSTTNGFTPSAANAYDCGMTAIVSLLSLTKNTTYYYIVACYDVFGKSLNGTGLNLSSQLTFTTPSTVGIASGSTLPTSGMLAGDTFYNTTDKTLYTYNATTSSWQAVGISTVSTLPGTGTVGQYVYSTTAGQLYTWNGSAWVGTTSSLAASSITGTLTAAQIASVNAVAINGTLTTTQIGPNTIQTGNIAAGAVTTDKLVVTGTGSALNDDPQTQDITAWPSAGSGSCGIVTLTDGQVGNTAIQNTTLGTDSNVTSRHFALSSSNDYVVSFWARTVSGSGQLWARLHQINGGGTAELAYNIGFESITVPSTWTYYSALVSPPAGTATGYLSLDINYPSSSATIQVQNFQVQQQISNALIVSGTITGDKLVVGTITAAQLAAGAVTTSTLAAGAVTSATIASGTITGTNIAASTITASNLNVSSLSAISANVGTLTAGTISNNSGTNTINLSATGGSLFINTPGFTVTASGTATFGGTLSGAIVNAGNMNVSSLSAISANLGAVTAGSVTMTSASSYIVFNNGTSMMVSGVGFGAGSNYLQWFGPTVSSASNFAACTDSNAKFYLKTDGSAYFGGKLAPIITRTYGYTGIAASEMVPYGVTSCTILAYGGGGGGAATKSSAYSSGGGGGAGFSQLTIAVSPGQVINYSVGGGGTGGSYTSGTGTFPGAAGGATTVSGTVAGGTISITANGGGGGGTSGGTGGSSSGGDYNSSGGAGTYGSPGHGGNAGTGGGLGATAVGSSSQGGGGNGGGGGASDNSSAAGGHGGSGYVYFSYN